MYDDRWRLKAAMQIVDWSFLNHAFRSSLAVGATWLLRQDNDSAGALAGAATSDAIGKRLPPRAVGVDAAPEFIPTSDSEPIVNRGRIADDATRLEVDCD
jgi:hypothetical protein